jgi:hypothetical protein
MADSNNRILGTMPSRPTSSVGASVSHTKSRPSWPSGGHKDVTISVHCPKVANAQL